MTSIERENFLRNAILIVDHSKDALVSLLEVNLSNTYQTFEQFINNNQHEIYHLYTSSRCCRCSTGYYPPRSSRILHQSQMDLLFDRSFFKLPCHNTAKRSSAKRSYDFCCSMARPGLSTNVLDLILAGCLLRNFCNEVFWFSCLQFQSITFEDFLNHNKHELYHLWQYNAPCCQCPQWYTFSTNSAMLDKDVWMKMFNAVLLPCPNHRKRPNPESMQSICSVAAAPGIKLINIDPSVSRIILQHTCTLWKAVDTLVQIRNQDYGHAKEGLMSDNDYNKSVVKIERCILDIAKVCNKETQFKQKLLETKYGALDPALLTQYQNKLMETVTRQADIHQSIADIEPCLNKIRKKIAANAGKIPKIIDECVQKGYTYQEQLMEKFNQTLGNGKDVQMQIEKEFLALREKIVKNWIFVKENSNPFSWRKQLRVRNFFQPDLKDIDSMCLERRDLAEFLLMKALQRTACKNMGDIVFLESIVLRNIEKNVQEKKEISKKASDYINCDTVPILTDHITEWERCLNRQDVIRIKDHLLQEAIITFEENEEFVNDKNYYNRDKTHLFSQIVRKVKASTSKGSVMCFIQHAENIIEHKQCGKKLIQIIKDRRHERMQPAKKTSLITKEDVKEYDKRIGQQGFLHLELKNKQNDKEVPQLLSQFEHNSDAVSMVFGTELGAECIEILKGSVVINFQSLDRDMCCSLDYRFADLICRLLKEVDLKNNIPIGDYTLTAKLSLTSSGNITDFDFIPLTDNISFLAAEKSFLEEEMDTDAVLDGLKERGKKIESIDMSQDHKYIAKKLLEAMIKDNLEKEFISILREYSMNYVLKRYMTFSKVYNTETVILKRNIIHQFSKIIQNTQIDNLRDVLLGLHIIDETTLHGIVTKCENRSDLAMATLILKCLTSGNAIHAFAYALLLQDPNPSEEMFLPESVQICDAESKNEMCLNTEGTNVMFEGRFNIVIRDVGTEKNIENVFDEPSSDSGMRMSTGIFCPACSTERQSTSTHMDDGDDRRRYYIVAVVFLEIVKPSIKQKLKTYYERNDFMCLHSFIECRTVKHILFHLRNRNILCCVDKENCFNHDELPLTYEMWDILYTKNQGENVHHCHCKYKANNVLIEELDLTLASLLLLNCCQLTEKETKLITNLQDFKDNYLSHNVDGLIAQTEFNSFWEDLTAYIVELNPNKMMDMVRLRDKTLDEPMHKEYVNILLDNENKHKRKAELSIPLPTDC